jgi:large repetitive protein
MDSRARFSLLAVVLLLGSLLTAYIATQITPFDPLAEFRQADGSIMIPGGKFTPELTRLLFPAPAPTSYWTYAPAHSAYPTLVMQGTEHAIPRISAPQPRPMGMDPLKGFFDTLTQRIMNFLDSISPVGTASAASRFLVLNNAGCTKTAIATDNDCWSATSGGGSSTVPGVSDDALLDANSGTGVGEMDAAMSVLSWNATGFIRTITTNNFALTSAGIITIRGTFNAGSSLITVNGNWNSSTATFNFGTSTVQFSSSGSLTTTAGTDGTTAIFYSLTIDAGTTVTLLNRWGFSGIMTINGTWAGTARTDVSDSQTAPFVFGVSGSYAGTGILTWRETTGVTVNIPARTDWPQWDMQPQAAGVVLNLLTGSTTVAAYRFLCSGSNTGELRTNANTFTVTGAVLGAQNGICGIDFGAGASTVIVGGNFDTNILNYVKWGGASAEIRGRFLSLSDNVNWSPGTGTVTFTSSTNQTMTFPPLAGSAFNNVTFTSSSASPRVFTMDVNALKLAGVMTLSDGTSTTALNTGGDLGITTNGVVVSAGGIFTANGSTIVNSGDWDSSAGTFTYGTSTISVNATGKTYTFGAGLFYDYITNNNSVTIDNVTMAANGALTAGSSAITVHGNWDTSTSASTFSQGTSTVTMDGTGKTLKILSTHIFSTLVIAGTVSLLSDGRAMTMTINSAKALTKTGFSIVFNHLSNNNGGSIVDGAITSTGFDVTNSDGAALTTISVFSVWTNDTEQKWTHTSDTPSTVMTFTISGQNLSLAFSVTKDGVPFTNDGVFAGTLTFTMQGSDPVVDVVEFTESCQSTCYWVGGTGNWFDGSHWAAVSGGPPLGSPPQPTSAIFFDNNSGSGTATVNVNTVVESLTINTTGGSAMTIAINAASVVISNVLTHSGGTLTISSGSLITDDAVISANITATSNGSMSFGSLTISGGIITMDAATLDVDGDLTMSGGNIIALSAVSTVNGNVFISATSAIDLGDSNWNISGTWTNNSTNGALWDAGTGVVTFTSPIGGTMTFAGSNLAENEFTSVVFTSSAGTPQQFTMSTRGLRANSISIFDFSSTTDLNTNEQTLTFKSISASSDGTMTMDGITVPDFSMTTSSGNIVLTNWAVYSPNSETALDWTFSPSDPGATITMLFKLTGNSTYDLKRNGVVVSPASESDPEGNIDFIVPGGWSGSDHMTSTKAATVGGGSPNEPTTPTPTPSPTSPSSLLNVYSLSLLAVVVGAVVAFIGYSARSPRLKFWGLVLLGLGILGLLWSLGYL